LDGDLGQVEGDPSPATTQQPSMPCCMCHQQVLRRVFAAHVAEHAREWL